jgi:hypothetical protein
VVKPAGQRARRGSKFYNEYSDDLERLLRQGERRYEVEELARASVPHWVFEPYNHYALPSKGATSSAKSNNVESDRALGMRRQRRAKRKTRTLKLSHRRAKRSKPNW